MDPPIGATDRVSLHRNTALFIDLENLFGGYGKELSDQLATISIRDVMAVITREGRAAGLIDQYAVKRAYADWSDSRLRVLRKELIEQGVEPRQVFAFGQNARRNAADVELVIDVLDLAYTREAIGTIVIVSGDGGFGALARRLHEFGRTVLVCSFADQTSAALKAVADRYLELGALLASPGPATPAIAPALRAQTEPPVARFAFSTDAICEIARGLPGLERRDREALEAYAAKLVVAVDADSGLGPAFRRDGMPLTNLGAAIRQVLNDYNYQDANLGLKDFLVRALEDTPFEVGHPEGQPNRHIVRRRDREPIEARREATSPVPGPLRFEDLQGLFERAEPLAHPSRDDAAAYLRVLVGLVDEDRVWGPALHELGISLNIFFKSVRSRIEGLDEAMIGFRAPTYFLRYALTNTPWAVAADAGMSRLILVNRDAVPPGFDRLDDVEEPDAEDVYRLILQQERLRLPSEMAALPRVLAEVCAQPPQSERAQELIERLAETAVLDDVPTETIKFGVLLLGKTGLLEAIDDDQQLPALERRYSLPPAMAQPERLLETIEAAVRATLQGRLGHLDEAVVARVLPWTTEPDIAVTEDIL